MTIAEALAEAAAILEIGEVPDARRDADTLLRNALSRDKAFVIAHPEYILRQDEEERFREFIERRANREPLQYIVGKAEFYGLDFEVTPDVLIPRPETESIVERAAEFLNGKTDATFCEVGVGSGCIAISILANAKKSRAIGGDVSEKALAVAAGNAARHDVDDRLSLIISDVFSSLTGTQFDVIVSNPPYVPEHDLETLQVEVGHFEPHIALSGGADGLSIIRRIIEESPGHLKPGGLLLVEIGFDQGNRVEQMFDDRIWERVKIEPDLQGIPRMVNAVRK